MNENVAAVLFAFSAGFIIVVHTMIVYAVGLRHGAGIYNKVERFILKHAYVQEDDAVDLDDLDDLQDYYQDDRYIGKYVIIGGYQKDDQKEN